MKGKLLVKGYFWSFVLVFSLFLVNVSAKSLKVSLPELTSKEIIKIAPGQQKSFKLRITANRINIGTKGIIGLFMKNKSTMVLTGKKAGFTTLLIQYSDGKIGEYGIRVLSMLPLDIVAEQLQEIFSSVKGLKIERAGDKIIIEGEIFDRDYQDYYQKTIGMYKNIVIDKVYMPKNPIIQIDVRIIEVNEENISDLGVQWFGDGGWQPKIKASYNYEKTKVLEASLEDVMIKINALAKEGKVHVLASPKLVVESGKSADFLVGGEIPIAQQTGLASSVDWKKYGTHLEISPKVMGDNRIFIKLNTTQSELDYSHQVSGYPSISSKEANTNLSMKENTTLVIAGLMSQNKSEEISKVPFFGDLPILGYLFKKKNKIIRNVETIILLTPSIVREKSHIKPSKKVEKFIGEVDKKN